MAPRARQGRLFPVPAATPQVATWAALPTSGPLVYDGSRVRVLEGLGTTITNPDTPDTEDTK